MQNTFTDFQGDFGFYVLTLYKTIAILELISKTHLLETVNFFFFSKNVFKTIPNGPQKASIYKRLSAGAGQSHSNNQEVSKTTPRKQLSFKQKAFKSPRLINVKYLILSFLLY